MVGLGEVLWDIFPDGRKLLGGAPANFAFHAHQLGHEGIVVSRVGEDELGQRILRTLSDRGLRTSAIQLDGTYATGTVHVVARDDGSHDFIITPNVAWDRLAATRELADLIAKADVICFGTLAQRGEANRSNMDLLLGRAEGLKVFDINLRQDYWSREVIEDGMRRSQIVKLNDDELAVIRKLGLAPEERDTVGWCRSVMAKYGLSLLAVTRGERGALLVTSEELAEEPGVKVSVADSVGAGDAFTAALADAWLRKLPLAEVARFANRVGAYVASRPGATPALPDEFRRT
ncbi:MAG: carbohydrate kinase [Phycisphaerae bacterium]|nr:carbohydrate kinase [Phycisphaerae bacterium]